MLSVVTARPEAACYKNFCAEAWSIPEPAVGLGAGSGTAKGQMMNICTLEEKLQTFKIVLDGEGLAVTWPAGRVADIRPPIADAERVLGRESPVGGPQRGPGR